jgi:methylthioribulose 1-phosphate dehydratase/enolase-phosphatase E1
MTRFSNFKAVICDIEGTLCHINFVHKVLFSYIRENLSSYLDQTWTTDLTRSDVSDLISQSEKDASDNLEGLVPAKASGSDDETRQSVIKNVLWQMSIDRKIAPLKNLQGHIWQRGYANGDLVAELFPDVLPTLRKLHSTGMPLYIYSSGSVGAQKLLFGHTAEGDATNLFSGFFDTMVGHKREQSSYTAIATALNLPAADCVFLTDIYEEAVAASAAGMTPVLMLRDGNAALPADHGFPTARSLEDLL